MARWAWSRKPDAESRQTSAASQSLPRVFCRIVTQQDQRLCFLLLFPCFVFFFFCEYPAYILTCRILSPRSITRSGHSTCDEDEGRCRMPTILIYAEGPARQH